MISSKLIEYARHSTWQKPRKNIVGIFGVLGLALAHMLMNHNYMVGIHFESSETRLDEYINLDNELQHRLLNSENSDAFHRLAILRATTPQYNPATKRVLKLLSQNRDNDSFNFDDVSSKDFATAIFLQVGYTHLWDDMLMCAANVATAISSTNGRYEDVDVYVALLNTSPTNIPRTTLNNKSGDLVTPKNIKLDLDLPSIGDIFVEKFDNFGADIGNFIHQLKRVDGSDKTYDVVLKMHTKGDNTWRERGIESLCGTPEQVLSILDHYQSDPLLDMINPLGTTFGPDTLTTDIYPHITRKYNVETETYAAAFDQDLKDKMKDLHRALFPSEKILADSEMAIVAGSMFWIRYSALHVPNLVDSLPIISNNMTAGYIENGASEHALERLFPTEVIVRGRRIAEMPPAPRIVAMYFPQFHPFPENDRFWGKGFTEWTILKPLELVGLRKPLSVQEGGLGYYDLRKTEVRRSQAKLARQAGLSGFIYYHYWFSGEAAPDNHKVMYQIQEAMLLDGEPDLPFALSWANEPWTKRWTGVTDEGSTLLSQEYGDESEWRDHFDYLLQFFRHPNYICEEGKPVFIIYRIGHVGNHLQPMLKLWREMALKAGLPGIHFVNTIGNFRYLDVDTSELEKEAAFDAAFHFWPQNFGSGLGPDQMQAFTGSVRDLDQFKGTVPIQYWGSFTGFDRRPRDASATPFFRSIQDFSDGLQCSFLAMGDNVKREVGRNLYFITAWNEWNEQATLEPDDINGFGYLNALHSELSKVPKVLVASKHGVQADLSSRAEDLKLCKPVCNKGRNCEKQKKKYVK